MGRVIGRAVVRESRVAALYVAALACVLAMGSTSAEAAPAKKPSRLNFVLIQTDDGPRGAFTPRVMPNLSNKLVDRGIRFTDAMTTTPLCCPSRMSLLTGQYSHNHGVTTNFYPKLKNKKNTLPVWLERKGYRTVHVGKYANGYERGGKDTRIAPGWTDWYTPAGKMRYYNYDLSVNGRRVHYGDSPRAHIDRVTTRRSVGVIRKHFRKRRTRNQPLYLQADYYSPHSGSGGTGRCSQSAAVPFPSDQGKFEGEPLPTPPSFDEQDVTDKPSFVRAVPSLTPESASRLSVRYRCALEALHSVDRGVKKIMKTLRRAKALNDTVVIFLNDNGFFFGEHRLASRLPTDQGGKFEPKVVPYEEAYQVPLIVRVPARVRGERGAAKSAAPVANIDIAPTILDLAKARPCRRKGKDCRLLDGTSFASILRGSSSFPTDRARLVEYRGRGNLPVCVYAGIVLPDTTYVEHTEVRLPEGGCEPADEREHYDLLDDPFQLENLFPAPPGSALEDEQQALEARLALLRNCAGAPGSTPKAGRPLCE
jgi:N-acetylglucosamine-6-sulfatase